MLSQDLSEMSINPLWSLGPPELMYLSYVSLCASGKTKMNTCVWSSLVYWCALQGLVYCGVRHLEAQIRMPGLCPLFLALLPWRCFSTLIFPCLWRPLKHSPHVLSSLMERLCLLACICERALPCKDLCRAKGEVRWWPTPPTAEAWLWAHSVPGHQKWCFMGPCYTG